MTKQMGQVTQIVSVDSQKKILWTPSVGAFLSRICDFVVFLSISTREWINLMFSCTVKVMGQGQS